MDLFGEMARFRSIQRSAVTNIVIALVRLSVVHYPLGRYMERYIGMYRETSGDISKYSEIWGEMGRCWAI